MNGRLYEIRKFTNLQEVNHYLANVDLMESFVAIWEYLGCGSETSEDGTIRPYYLLGQKLYHRSDFDEDL